MSKTQTATLYNTAFRLLVSGFSVIPSGAGKDGKAPAVEWIPRQVTPASEAELEAWEAELMPPLWGIVTGAVSKVVVIDADDASSRAILENKGLAPHIITPRGGAHFYFEHPGKPIKTCVGILPHIDIRADGGFANVTGECRLGEYKIMNLPGADNLYPWDKLPAQIVKALTAPSTLTHKEAEPILEGQRNSRLTSIAGAMRRQGTSQETITACLLAINQGQCQPPLPDTEVTAIAKSTSRYAPTPDLASRRDGGFDWRTHMVSLSDLMAKEFEPLEFLVRDLLITPGLGVMAAPKKRGKTWLALQLSQAIASGAPFLGMATKQGSVVHMALEDGERRIRQRFGLQNIDGKLPIHLQTKFQALNTPEGMTAFREMIKELKPLLIVIDTLASAKTRKLDENEAGANADLFNLFHTIALENNLFILIIAHHGKMSTGDAGFDIRGSSAIPGATDVNIGLYKNEDGSCDLKAEGRDIGEVDLAIEFDAEQTWAWQCKGDARELRRDATEERITNALEDLNGEADIYEIAGALGVHRQTVHPQLERMKGRKLISATPIRRGNKQIIIYKLLPFNNNNTDTTTIPTLPTPVVNVGNEIPEYPHKPCPTCKDSDYWLSKDNEWHCRKCHPEPKK